MRNIRPVEYSMRPMTITRLDRDLRSAEARDPRSLDFVLLFARFVP